MLYAGCEIRKDCKQVQEKRLRKPKLSPKLKQKNFDEEKGDTRRHALKRADAGSKAEPHI